MIYNRCNRCNARYPAGSTGCKCYSKNLAVNKPNVNQYYNTLEWRKLRELAKSKTFGLDIYSLLVLNKIEYGFTVHHIIPLEVDFNLRNQQNNLIYLTEANHRLIHSLYKNSYEMTRNKLYLILEKFQKKYRGY